MAFPDLIAMDRPVETSFLNDSSLAEQSPPRVWNSFMYRLRLACFLGLATFFTLGREMEAMADPPCKHVWIETKSGPQEIVGEVVVEAVDGGLLLLGPDGRLTVVQPKEIKRIEDVSSGFRPMTSEQVGTALLQEMPKGFKIYKTAHYVFCYDTSDAYAKWTGILFEKLHREFYAFWKRKGVKLEEPRIPLIALVFQTKASYLRYAQPELGRSAESMLGYYNLMSNRVTTFDLTGIEGAIPDGHKVDRIELVEMILAQPSAERNVATIVHEAVHQLAYNSGLQTRLADNPVWVSEGLAVFFETPDPTKKGTAWGSVGKVNYHNLNNFRLMRRRGDRSEKSLPLLLTDNDRFRKGNSIQDAYAESWAMNYFLLKKKPKEYCEYLKYLSTLPPLGVYDDKDKVADFKRFFGNDLISFDREFLKFMDGQ